MCETELNNKDYACYFDFWHSGIFSDCPYECDKDCRECERYRNDDDLK